LYEIIRADDGRLAGEDLLGQHSMHFLVAVEAAAVVRVAA
jgi:hypothetical protein